MTRFKVFTLFLALFCAIPALQGMDTVDLSNYGAASILPYCIDKQNGDVFFLLGLGSDSHEDKQYSWGDFGGFRDDGDQDSFGTALREFEEETRSYYKRADYISKPRPKPFVYSYEVKGETFTHHAYPLEVEYVEPQKIAQLPTDVHTEKCAYVWVKATDFMNMIGTIKPQFGRQPLPHETEPRQGAPLTVENVAFDQTHTTLSQKKYNLRFNFFNALKTDEYFNRLHGTVNEMGSISKTKQQPEPEELPTGDENSKLRPTGWLLLGTVCAIPLAAVYGLYTWYNKTEDTDEDDVETEVATEVVE